MELSSADRRHGAPAQALAFVQGSGADPLSPLARSGRVGPFPDLAAPSPAAGRLRTGRAGSAGIRRFTGTESDGYAVPALAELAWQVADQLDWPDATC